MKVVDAFLVAARSGDFEGLLAVLDPDVVFRADHVAVQMGGRPETRGAAAVANTFKGRTQAPFPLWWMGKWASWSLRADTCILCFASQLLAKGLPESKPLPIRKAFAGWIWGCWSDSAERNHEPDKCYLDDSRCSRSLGIWREIGLCRATETQYISVVIGNLEGP
jgi:hypothetical protein